ncbi:uncharacterized protein DFL_009731 [Arthrobotrys flagrans]|uniref:3CxxC-type domain-containing protein n=1 Tax=Arthrobotrys flagrans TaxID=97331 RepID=A0A436ZSH3_ARTFL|nr:hypothetical protein DFL_009731 [Arthrobotrys flagrans]
MASIKTTRIVLLQTSFLRSNHRAFYVTSSRVPFARRASNLASDASDQPSATSSNNKLPVIPQRRDQNSDDTTNSASVDAIFQQELRGMNKAILNGLKISGYPRSQRRLIDQERCRRRAEEKAAAANKRAPTPPTTGIASNTTSSTSMILLGPSVSNDDTSSKHAKETPKSWYMFLEYHDLVVKQTPGVCFNISDVEGVYQWSTNLRGSFKCSEQECKNNWQSAVVATIIRKYPLPGNMLAYNAKVFNQRCKTCDSLGYMTIDRKIYLERVVRRLKIWRNEKVDELPKNFRKTEPHKSELCEGCKAGYCKREDGEG